MHRVLLSLTAACTALIASHALADDWYADRLRGVVLMMVDAQWVPIERGTVVSDARVIRTGANGQVTFRSGDQVIELSRNTQIQISSAESRDHTWVLHAGGELTADVEARDVEHFGVRTQHMIAVVKGTRFTVSANEETADVIVERGTVAVNESQRGLSVSISAGQRASGGSGRLQVGGEGNLPNVLDAAGRPLPLDETRLEVPGQSNASHSAAAVARGNWGNILPTERGAENLNATGPSNGNGPAHGNGGNATQHRGNASGQGSGSGHAGNAGAHTNKAGGGTSPSGN